MANEFSRLLELRDLTKDLSNPDSYFHNFQDRLKNKHVLQKYLEIENYLLNIDECSWALLKEEAAPFLDKKHDKRGWQSLFDILNQAKACSVLLSIGLKDVSFIPRSKIPGKKTPDIKAIKNGISFLCEVKTINISDDEASIRGKKEVRNISLSLDSGFFNKLQDDIATAKKQLCEYDTAHEAQWLVFIFINYDDFFKTFEQQYLDQINKFIVENPIFDIDVVCKS